MLVALIAVLLLLAVACAENVAAPNPTAVSPTSTAVRTATPAGVFHTPVPTGFQPAIVLRVIDGDTIEVQIEDAKHTVRYIGIDTPETKHPTVGVEYFGKEAEAKNKSLVEGQTVYLEKDVSETDQFDRLLRYVYVGHTMVNAVLVMEGYAQAATYPPDIKYADWFRELQQGAMENGRGLWATTEEPETTPVSYTTPVPTQHPDCDTAYTTVCIPPPPPDLDCNDIAFKRFAVRPPDPHRFDSDGNGTGCES